MARFRVERRVGRPVPVGDAPAAGPEALGDPDSVSPGSTVYDGERGLGRRRRADERRGRRRAGGRRDRAVGLASGGGPDPLGRRTRSVGRRPATQAASQHRGAIAARSHRTRIVECIVTHRLRAEAHPTRQSPRAARRSRPASAPGARTRRPARGPRRPSRSGRGRRAWRRSRRGRRRAGLVGGRAVDREAWPRRSRPLTVAARRLARRRCARPARRPAARRPRRCPAGGTRTRRRRSGRRGRCRGRRRRARRRSACRSRRRPGGRARR